MDNVVTTAADTALAELLEVSPQVDAAVIVERASGSLLANAPASSARSAERFGSLCTKLLAAAERSRTELGREPVTQIEVATGDGHVFVVADATCIVAAVTDADPTVGLVFYDLKTSLRSIREARAGANGTSAAAAPAPSAVTPIRAKQQQTDGAADPEARAGEDGATDEESGSRWRRRKR